MSKKPTKSVTSKILKFAMIIPAALNLMGNLSSLIQLEMASMRKKLLCFFLLSLFSLMLLLTTWILLNALLLTALIHASFTLIPSMVIVLSGNFLLLIITCLMMINLKVDPSFPETRKTIREIVKKK